MCRASKLTDLFISNRKKCLLLHLSFSISADEAFDGSYPTNVVLTSEGGCTYIPPGIFKSTCKIDITWFPFDDQDCEMKFGSWTYDGGKVRKIIKLAVVFHFFLY
jgi:hypothetical protein